MLSLRAAALPAAARAPAGVEEVEIKAAEIKNETVCRRRCQAFSATTTTTTTTTTSTTTCFLPGARGTGAGICFFPINIFLNSSRGVPPPTHTSDLKAMQTVTRLCRVCGKYAYVSRGRCLNPRCRLNNRRGPSWVPPSRGGCKQAGRNKGRKRATWRT